MSLKEDLKLNNQNLKKPILLLRFIRLFPWVLRLQLVRYLILKKFKYVRECQISPGFYAVIAENLKANNSNLNDTVFINYAQISIGENTRFFGQSLLLTSSHRPENFMEVVAQPIIIGKNVWISYRCIILGGVTIGDNVIIGAGSVVVNDIPSNVIASGNPCRIIMENKID